MIILSSFPFLFCLFLPHSWQTGNREMGFHLATEFCLVLHCPQLQQTPLGEVVYGDVCFLYAVDRSLLLHDGVDGECVRNPVHRWVSLEPKVCSTRDD